VQVMSEPAAHIKACACLTTNHCSFGGKLVSWEVHDLQTYRQVENLKYSVPEGSQIAIERETPFYFQVEIPCSDRNSIYILSIWSRPPIVRHTILVLRLFPRAARWRLEWKGITVL
jgi:hypothetical protein